MNKQQKSKAGVVALVGRPNVGKSTLLNNLLQHKVSITSPRPQTTRFPVQAVYEDDRGQIIFVDTPGMFARSPDALSKKINNEVEKIFSEDFDVILYVIDYTRPRDTEENKILGMVRKATVPVILVVNKIDASRQDYAADYAFYEDEFKTIVKISALKRANFNVLLDAVYTLLPHGEKLVDASTLAQPGLNIDSQIFIKEIIREKVFLFVRDELPYTVDTHVDRIEERKNGDLYIEASIVTTADQYKKMLIGREGKMIKKIGMAVRKELEQASGKQVYIRLQVDVNPHWQDAL